MTNSPYQDALEHLEKMIRIAAPLILDIQDRKTVIESHLFLADAKKRMAAFTGFDHWTVGNQKFKNKQIAQ